MADKQEQENVYANQPSLWTLLKRLTDPELRNLDESAAFAQNWTKAKSGGYTTELNPTEEALFRLWLNLGGNPSGFDPEEKTPVYDMRGYFKSLLSQDPKAVTKVGKEGRTWFPQNWVTPYSSGFGEGSKYWNK